MNKAECPMAQPFHINTRDFTRKLKEGGVEEKAAETIAETVAEAIGSSDVATGTQLELTKRELKSEMTEVRNEIGRLDNKIDKVDNKIDTVYNKIDEVRNELKSDMNAMFFKNVAFIVGLVTLINALFKYVLN